MKHFCNVFTVILYLIDAANSDKSMICDLARTTQVCLFYWYVGCSGRRFGCDVQMKRWDITMLGHSVCSNMACTPSAMLRPIQINGLLVVAAWTVKLNSF